MKITERKIRDLALAILCALVGYALCACGEGASESAGIDGGVESSGTLRSDAGVSYCEIPSPTGGVKLLDPHGSPVSESRLDYYVHAAETGGAGRWGIVTNAGDWSKTCVGYSANASYTMVSPATGKPETVVDPCVSQVPAAGCDVTGTQVHYSRDALVTECRVTMTTAECADVAHDFVDEAGFSHCLQVTCQIVKDAQGIDTQSCQLGGVGVLVDAEVDVALCSPQGKFLGWSCPSPDLVSCD